MTRYTCGFFPRILAIIPATRYTCVFLSRILAFFPALWGVYSQVYDHFFLQRRMYMRTKKPIYMSYKQAILGDSGAVSRAGRKGATKVFKHRRKSPWVPTLTRPFPKGQANSGSYWAQKDALYYFAQSANSFS